MNIMLLRFGALALAVAVQVCLAGLAFAQGNPASPGAAAPPQGYAGGGAQMIEATPANEPTPGTDLPVLYVTAVEVIRTSIEPKLDIVRVTGLTGSQGWSAPQLVPTYIGKALDGILDLQFIATMPDQTQPAEGFVPNRRGFSHGGRPPVQGGAGACLRECDRSQADTGSEPSANQCQRLQRLCRQEIC
jgi:hypothetical protein